MNKAIVYLVGAGPGDYKLISLKAKECIEKADVIVYDRLADNRLLSWTRKDAELIYVGKASSQHTMRQEDINKLLVVKAKENKIVCRLKGGDPFVFGRGGEEAIELLENNIPFEIVPGITSAISVPAYAGIPVTHRGIATSFAVITGHEDPTKGQSSMRWEKLATGTDTLVFLMGVENIPNITTNLIKHGRNENTPAAIIRWGTKPEQEVFVTTVKDAASDVEKYNIKPPAIFIVGEVVKLRKELQWFDNKSLFGKKIIVTRAREQASALTEKLEALGAHCIETPSIKITEMDDYQKLDEAIQKLDSYNFIIFTSVNGVDYFFKRLHKLGKDSRALASAKIAAIGTQTADHLRTYGLLADIVPTMFIAEGILAALEGHIKPNMNILIPRAEVARDILPIKLREQGANVDVAPTYQTKIADVDSDTVKEILAKEQVDVITFTSSSTVTNLLAILGDEGKELISKAQIACIGPITAATCKENGIKVDTVADEYTIQGLVDVVAKMCKGE